MIWNNTSMRNGKLVRLTRWAVLPDKRNEMAAIHTFTSGEAVIEARLILEADYGEAPSIVVRATVVDSSGAEATDEQRLP